ncbi:unnamed protein product [Paramecium primaurelia]|uniref:Uncharacterized protein n=1 Tax=Paramecium primaurelia TaxID=5886 RepID=A0A8S1NQA5_PARPR|nr:unnamed protein product [Paramecium primaurelia]
MKTFKYIIDARIFSFKQTFQLNYCSECYIPNLPVNKLLEKIMQGLILIESYSQMVSVKNLFYYLICSKHKLSNKYFKDLNMKSIYKNQNLLYSNLLNIFFQNIKLHLLIFQIQPKILAHFRRLIILQIKSEILAKIKKKLPEDTKSQVEQKINEKVKEINCYLTQLF